MKCTDKHFVCCSCRRLVEKILLYFYNFTTKYCTNKQMTSVATDPTRFGRITPNQNFYKHHKPGKNIIYHIFCIITRS